LSTRGEQRVCKVLGTATRHVNPCASSARPSPTPLAYLQTLEMRLIRLFARAIFAHVTREQQRFVHCRQPNVSHTNRHLVYHHEWSHTVCVGHGGEEVECGRNSRNNDEFAEESSLSYPPAQTVRDNRTAACRSRCVRRGLSDAVPLSTRDYD
jgi:hypothetical protein